MPADPLTPEEQAEVDTVLMLADRVERRDSYTTPFGQALARLNAICARIFNRQPDDGPRAAGSEGW